MFLNYGFHYSHCMINCINIRQAQVRDRLDTGWEGKRKIGNFVAVRLEVIPLCYRFGDFIVGGWTGDGSQMTGDLPPVIGPCSLIA